MGQRIGDVHGVGLPASGQTWQTVTKLSQGATMTVQPSDITGSVDGNGVVKLTMAYNVEIALSLLREPGEVPVTGTVDLSSAGTDTASQGRQQLEPCHGRLRRRRHVDGSNTRYAMRRDQDLPLRSHQADGVLLRRLDDPAAA